MAEERVQLPRPPTCTRRGDARETSKPETGGECVLDYFGEQSPMPAVATPRRSEPHIEAYKKDIDRTLLRENLKLSVEQRFRKLMALQRLAEELHRAGPRVKNGGL